MTSDIKEQIKSLDVAVDMGGGGEYRIAPSISLIVDARYSLGLSNVVKDNQQTLGMKTTGIQFIVGVLLNL